MKPILFAILICILFSTNIAWCNENNLYLSREQVIGLVKEINLSVYNTVNNNCLTNEKELRDRIRFRLEEAGIKVHEDKFNYFPSPKGLDLGVLLFGSKEETCIASAITIARITNLMYPFPSHSIKSDNNQEVYIMIDGLVWEMEGVFSSQGNLDDAALRYINNVMDNFLADYYSAQKDERVKLSNDLVFEYYPIQFTDGKKRKKRTLTLTLDPHTALQNK
ncbi:hypothetical protein [Oceanidesulfovibrio marinus]|uniref:Uncharacterized protein n=1 Tax=Oceanidesulfovibrio marinus TaxID=370038 RepID=A0ABX6NHM2_9BACT|nr:hypothetical protein [Oceanidesulfovibrio marinus]QJT10128.1 hypothetical protein E8L03_14840 [Oceanidesulfovibrio marinus]